MQHCHGLAVWTWLCSMEMDKQYGFGHAAWTWTYSMDIGISISWTWTCRMNTDRQHEHGQTAWIRTGSMDMAGCPSSSPCCMSMSMLHVLVHSACYVHAACSAHAAYGTHVYAACPSQCGTHVYATFRVHVRFSTLLTLYVQSVSLAFSSPCSNTWTRSMDLNMQHWYGHAARTWTCRT